MPLWLQSSTLQLVHNYDVAKHLAMTRLPFAIFPAGISQKVSGETGREDCKLLQSVEMSALPKDQGIHLMMATETAQIADIKRSGCTLQPHCIAAAIPLPPPTLPL